MVAHRQMCGVVLLLSALALALGEEKTSIETSEDTNKEQLNPEASGRLFGLDHLLFNKFGIGSGRGGGGWGGGPGGGWGGGPGGGWGGGPGGGWGGGAGGGWGPVWDDGGFGGFDKGYGGRGRGYGMRSGISAYGTSGYGGYGNTGNGDKYRNYDGLGTGLGSSYTSGYGTSGSYEGSYSPYIKKYWK